ncbi:MAG: hypothetical protein ACRENX_07250 [Candidatus Dormibacteria bacterium]
MTVRETRNSGAGRGLRQPPLLVRSPGQRCDFCGSLTSTAAVARGRQPAGVVICPGCVERAAQQLHRPGGGDAA